MENYDCNSGCGGCGRKGGGYASNKMNIYSQENPYSVKGDDDEEKKYRRFGGY